MSICGIDALVFGVEDLAKARRFLDDWGLADAGSTDEVLTYEALNGAQVIVRHLDDARLPPAMERGSTLREIVWGAQDGAALAAAAARANSTGLVEQDAEGRMRLVDPNGLSHVLQSTRTRPYRGAPVQSNAPGRHERVDRRAPVYLRARPANIGHVVLFVDNLDASLGFFLDRLGFAVSDRYPGHAAFLRAQTPGVHHNAFILQRPGAPGLNHVAFTLNDLHEVVGGGLAMGRGGWKTELGPGRHPISSALFWYFESPLGAAWEYYADEDYCTEAWVPRDYERSPENFAEWAVAGGLDGFSRRQAKTA